MMGLELYLERVSSSFPLGLPFQDMAVTLESIHDLDTQSTGSHP
jgi:hypothetical protein